MIHVLGLAHSETTAEWEACAFTSRTRDFATMMTRAGAEVILYAGEANEAEVDEHVALISRAEQVALLPGFDRSQVFNEFDPEHPLWRLFNARAIDAVRERARPGDVLAVTMGTTHRPVADALADRGMLIVETGIGYPGVWAPYRVYESRAWRHFLAAKEPRDDMRAYDEVIPRAWLAEQFPEGSGTGGYVLFMGRLTARKGPHIAAEAAKRAGVKLVVAGQGAISWSRDLIVCGDGTRLEGDVEYLGVLGAAERAEVMGQAAAVLVPTQYFEPLGGVSIEAQLTGTPVIVSNWGGLPENVVEGETGFACDLLRDYVSGIERAASLDRGRIREHAITTWSTDAIAPRFTVYFDRLSTLYGPGWYA